MARFENVSCSQCGQDFGPGDHGYSQCKHHREASYEEFQRDNLYRELNRAQKIIDHLKQYRESLVTCPFESTPLMRSRIDELSCECRDDYDRAVQMLLGDFKRLLGRALEVAKDGFPPGSCAHCGEFHSHVCDAMKEAMAGETCVRARKALGLSVDDRVVETRDVHNTDVVGGVPCPNCGGHGMVGRPLDDDPGARCEDCNGTGRTSPSGVSPRT